MSKSRKKSAEKKQWFTVAYLTREGIPHPAHHGNFSRRYQSTRILLEDLVYSMTHEISRRGAYVASIWPGEISEWEALHGATKPLYYVFESGIIEKLQ
jgi:hypothetical protein